MKNNRLLQAIEVIVLGGIVVAFLLPVLFPSEAPESSEHMPSNRFTIARSTLR